MPETKPRHPAALHGVQRTLFVPLIVRARAPLWQPWLDPHDRLAGDVLARSGESPAHYPTDAATALNILWRTHKIKQIGTGFFERFHTAQGVNLGAGLTDYFQWLDNGHNRWTDVDMPDVVALRQRWLPAPGGRTGLCAQDLRQPGWWQRLGLPRQGRSQPLLLISEGVLMYMRPTEVKAFFREIGEHAPDGSELVCDFISPVGVGQTPACNQHPDDAVAFCWGAHSGEELAAFHPRLHWLQTHSVAEAWGWCGPWLEAMSAPWTGGPMYAMAHLRVGSSV